MYNLEQAVQRLQWRFSSNKPFKPNENDIEAINKVFGWINNEKKKNVLKYSLFIKLYIYELTTITRQYEIDILESICQKKLHQMLATPLEHFIKAFELDLYNNQAKRIIERSKEGVVITPEMIKQKYDSEFIKDRLLNMATDALNEFS